MMAKQVGTLGFWGGEGVLLSLLLDIGIILIIIERQTSPWHRGSTCVIICRSTTVRPTASFVPGSDSERVAHLIVRTYGDTYFRILRSMYQGSIYTMVSSREARSLLKAVASVPINIFSRSTLPMK